MVRYAPLSFFLLVTSVLVQTSYCSRSPPMEPRAELQKPAASSVVVIHGDERLRRRGEPPLIRAVEEEVIADPAGHHGTAVSALAGGHGDGAGSRRRSGGGALARVWRHAVVPHLKLARRFLVGQDTDSAAGPSCRSSNPHITCAPPAPH